MKKNNIIHKLKIKKNKINIEKLSIKNNVFVADIETVLINNRHWPIMVGIQACYSNFQKIYNINILNNKNLNEEDSQKIILNFLTDCSFLETKNKKKIYIYFHNLSSFDGIFLLNIINKNSILFKDINIFCRENKIYEIRLFNNIIIRDSFLLLPIDLKTLSDNIIFEKENQKKKIDYTIFKNWELIKKNINDIELYLKSDLISLSKILISFREMIFFNYKIDIKDVLTISSLAFKIYRKNFMQFENIYKSNININIDLFLRNSFFGGMTNVFKPKSDICYHYDVNSLYPASMLLPMPIGKPIEHRIFEKSFDIHKFFGFLECKISIPKNLYFPPLVKKHENLLVNATGILTGIWFSEEIKNAIKNYNCSIIDIYFAIEYKNQIIFKEYVEHFYFFKNKNDYKKIFYKLLLNSLFGRFGFKISNSHQLCFLKEDEQFLYDLFYKLEQNFPREKNNLSLKLTKITTPESHELLNPGDILKLPLKKEEKELLNKWYKKLEIKEKYTNVAVQIASAITAYSRIFMVNCINEEINNDNIIFYMDTDSIICAKPLQKKWIDENQIGKFKLVEIAEQGIFVAPKIYSLKIKNEWKTTFKGLNKQTQKLLETDQNLENMLKTRPFIQKNVEKTFHKSFNDLEINSINTNLIFTLENKKRILIYDNHGNWIDTTPLHFENN